MVAAGSTNEEVAEKLGFASSGSFRREFVAVYGLRPADYVEAFAERAELSRREFPNPPAEDGERAGVLLGLGKTLLLTFP